MKIRILLFAAFLVLYGFTGAATAEVVVDTVAATQLDFPLFTAVVIAHGGTDLDVDLLVNGTLLGAPTKISRVEYDRLNNLTLWKLVYNSAVVKPGDVLTGVVTDVSGETAHKDATCGPGFVRLRQTAICK